MSKHWTKFDIPRKTLLKMSPEERRREGFQLPEEALAKNSTKREKDLQKTVSDWLRVRGYFRRSPADIREKLPPRGWQVHIVECRKNPLLLDFLLLGNSGKYLEFELKIPGGRYSSKEQKMLCENHGKSVFTEFDAVREYVLKWEKGNN